MNDSAKVNLMLVLQQMLLDEYLKFLREYIKVIVFFEACEMINFINFLSCF